MLSLFIVISLVVGGYSIKSKSTTITEFYGKETPYILSYQMTNCLLFDLVKTNKCETKDIPLAQIKGYGGSAELFNTILDTVGDLNYVEAQNDPRLIETSGGNCQAYTLLLDAYFKKYGFVHDIVFSDTHMYNKVKVNEIWYKVDYVNNIMEQTN